MIQRATLEEVERKMQGIAKTVKAMVPEGWGFAVLCFSYGEGGFMNWVSNAQRADMIKALREMADKLENDRRDFHRTPKPPDYMSPHCTSGNCKYCRGRREAARRAATARLEAAAAPGMFWDRKIGGHQEQLGPSAPDAWIQTFVRR